MKKFCLALCLILTLACLFGCGSKKDSGLTEESYVVEIEIEEYGKITVALDAKTAPITVENFISYVKDGFYDGLTFHRITKGFMMQGGDQNGDGINNEGTPSIKGEFAYNGVENNISHTRGTISMARSQSYNSASTQFFIVHEDSLFLDGQYAAFGKVIDGMDVVDAVCNNAVNSDGNGSVPEAYRPVIKEIRIVE